MLFVYFCRKDEEKVKDSDSYVEGDENMRIIILNRKEERIWKKDFDELIYKIKEQRLKGKYKEFEKGDGQYED